MDFQDGLARASASFRSNPSGPFRSGLVVEFPNTLLNQVDRHPPLLAPSDTLPLAPLTVLGLKMCLTFDLSFLVLASKGHPGRRSEYLLPPEFAPAPPVKTARSAAHQAA
jgi:hypothetical protein